MRDAGLRKKEVSSCRGIHRAGRYITGKKKKMGREHRLLTGILNDFASHFIIIITFIKLSLLELTDLGRQTKKPDAT